MTLEAGGAWLRNFLEPAHADCISLREVVSIVVMSDWFL